MGRQYQQTFIDQMIDGRRLLVLMSSDFLYHFVRNRDHVLLIIGTLEGLAPSPQEFGWEKETIRHRYRLMELIHIGEFSTTHQAVDLTNGNRICALKIVCRKKICEHLLKEIYEKLIIREVALKNFFSNKTHGQHENMIQFYEYQKEVCYRGAIYDYIIVREHHLLDLQLLTENRIPLGEEGSKRILHQLVSLLCFFRK